MRTYEIQNERWTTFFADFTYRHHGKHVSVETLGSVNDIHPEVRDEPLVGIVAASENSRECLELLAGKPPEHAHVHAIARPLHVTVGREDNGQTVALQIDSADGTTTMVRFEPPQEGLPAGFRLS